MSKGILITDELSGKIDRFSEREAKVVVSKFHRFAAAVQCLDFSAADTSSRYTVRDRVNHLAKTYGLAWDKTDTDAVLWRYEGSFKVDKNYSSYFSVGFEIDYYEIDTADLVDWIPGFIGQTFGSITLDNAKDQIRKEIIESINREMNWH